MTFHTYQDVLRHLDNLGLFHMDMHLDRMYRAIKKSNLAQQFVPAVQIVGTNGKGSTSTFLAFLAQAHGLKVGLHTSPHFLSPRERIRINGEMLPEEYWADLASRVYDAAPDLTYFEFLTVLALLAFVDAKVDLAVLETGLGGRYDATTAVPVQMLCYVPIGMDHEQILGNTLKQIAEDKAGAIRPMSDGIVLSGPQETEAMQCLEQASAKLKIPFVRVENCDLPFGLLNPAKPDSVPQLGLLGQHQIGNARLALAAWDILRQKHHWSLTEKAVRQGLATAWLPGRLQLVQASAERPALLLDGAHNPHGLRALVQSLSVAKIKPKAVIFSCLADKKWLEMISLVLQAAQNAPIFLVTIEHNERALDEKEMVKAFGGKATPTSDLPTALKMASLGNAKEPILICGSLYLLSEVFEMYPELLESPKKER